MLEKIIFTEAATTIGGRTGHCETPDGLLKLDLARPTAMGGPGGGTNPEQLFACGYSACFGGTLEFLATQRKLPLAKSEVTAHVSFGNAVGGGFGIAAEIEVRLPGLAPADAAALLEAAHQNCPYSRATRGNIDVTLKLVD